jgi:hypothetical protein
MGENMKFFMAVFALSSVISVHASSLMDLQSGVVVLKKDIVVPAGAKKVAVGKRCNVNLKEAQSIVRILKASPTPLMVTDIKMKDLSGPNSVDYMIWTTGKVENFLELEGESISSISCVFIHTSKNNMGPNLGVMSYKKFSEGLSEYFEISKYSQEVNP